MLAIAGGKGGSGKTTTALGLASALAQHGRHPLVVDCDVDMPNLHHTADIPDFGGVDSLADGARIEQATRESVSVPGVNVLTGGRRSNLDEALRRVSPWHGPVLLDCPAGISPDATRPLRHGDATVLVSTDRPQAIEDTLTTAHCARNLDAPPLTVFLRRTPGGDGSTWPDCEYPSVRVPTVQSPRDEPKLGQIWRNWASKLIRGEFRRLGGVSVDGY